jgi:hypothetical protein
MQKRGRSRGNGTRDPILTIIGVVLIVAGALGAQMAWAAQVQVKSGPAGEFGVHARGGTTEQTLQALAARAGFDVVIVGQMPATVANLTMSLAPLDEVLHEVLRGRNYALMYDAETAALRRVIVLPPASTRAYASPRRPAAKTRRGKPVGPVVIRR